jgi:L-threonylcarbamoyladenylate synthase
MSNPIFTIPLQRRTPRRSLFTGDVQRIKNLLSNNGMLLLPSDTGYSLAAVPANEQVYTTINLILDRGEMPVSLAFDSLFSVDLFIELNNVVAALLEMFTPGGITIVCKAREQVPAKFIRDSIHVFDHTIGVRIPDSKIEREVARSCNAPITTVAVRDANGAVVQDFNKALAIVSAGMERVGFANWAAVEGDLFLAMHSTVVRIVNPQTGAYKIERPGSISETEIANCLQQPFSRWAAERI